MSWNPLDLWERWVARTEERVDGRPLRLTLIFLAMAILGDQFAAIRRGATDAILYDHSMGGINQNHSNWYMFEGIAHAEPVIFAILAVAMLFVVAGRFTRPALLIGLLASAQLGHAFLPGDRAIDRLIRTAFLILLFSEVSDDRPAARIARWPIDLLRFLLMLVYFGAGAVKLDAQPGWFDATSPELYQILADPLAGRLSPEFWAPVTPLFRLAGAVTIAFELTPFLIFTRLRPYWALIGVTMHVGIAFMMDLGMFSWGMLAFYPLLLDRWTIQALDRLAPWLPAFLQPPPGSSTP